MKINSENLQQIARAAKTQNPNSHSNETKDDSNFINPTGDSKDTLITNMLGVNNTKKDDSSSSNSTFKEKKNEDKKILIEELEDDSYNVFKKQIEQNKPNSSSDIQSGSRGYD